MKSRLIALFMIIGVFILSGMASATVLPPADPEFIDFLVSTSCDVNGSINQRTQLEWGLSSEVLGSNLVIRGDPPEPVSEPEPPLNPGGEVQVYIVYDEDTQANMGEISYRKNSEIDTHPKVGTDYNVENERLITFTGFGAGKILSSEDIVMDNVGNCFLASESFICPFLAGEGGSLPPFCNRFEAGSALDMSLLSLHTSSGTRNVNRPASLDNWPPIPSADDPALARYLIQVTTLGSDIPSEGSVSTYLAVASKEGRSESAGCLFLFEEKHIEETRSISGTIPLFDYQVDYWSGFQL
jgi:hypothetical protein